MKRFNSDVIIKIVTKIGKDTVEQIKKAQLTMVAASLAYATIMSIIPLLAMSFAIFKAFGGMQRLFDMIEPLVLSYLTEGSSEEVLKTIHGFIDNAHTTVVGIGGMVGLILTSMVMLLNIENAINHVWQTKVSRTLFQRISSYWLFITLGPLAFSIAVGAATSANLPLTHLLPSGTGIFLIAVGGFFGIYKFVPQAEVKWQVALTSSIVTAFIWNIARTSYVLYTKNTVSYNNVYGSLSAIPILLLWIYIIWVIVLAGAAFTAALQKNILEKPNQST